MESTTQEAEVPATALISDAIQQSNRDWEEGRATSPDTYDFVLLADAILTKTDPSYPTWTRDKTAVHEAIAGAMWELQCDGKLAEWDEMAEWLVRELTGP